MKANSTCQRSEKDVSPTCFYFDEIFILNITLLLCDSPPFKPGTRGNNQLCILYRQQPDISAWCDTVFSRVPQKKVSHILDILNSVSHKTANAKDQEQKNLLSKHKYPQEIFNFWHNNSKNHYVKNHQVKNNK